MRCISTMVAVPRASGQIPRVMSSGVHGEVCSNNPNLRARFGAKTKLWSQAELKNWVNQGARGVGRKVCLKEFLRWITNICSKVLCYLHANCEDMLGL